MISLFSLIILNFVIFTFWFSSILVSCELFFTFRYKLMILTLMLFFVLNYIFSKLMSLMKVKFDCTIVE
jgi:hypothetical protein